MVQTRPQFEFCLMAVAEEVHAILKALLPWNPELWSINRILIRIIKKTKDYTNKFWLGEDNLSEKEVAYPSYPRISGLKNNLPVLWTSTFCLRLLLYKIQTGIEAQNLFSIQFQ
jgi:hypothetical protein